MLTAMGNMIYNIVVKLPKGKTSVKWRYKKILTTLLFLTLPLTLAGCGGSGSGSSSESVTLTWDAPTTNTDGTPLTDLAGYIVYYGTPSNNYTNSVNIGNSTGAVISNLSPGTWYFAVTAYDTSGNESSFSNEVSTTI